MSSSLAASHNAFEVPSWNLTANSWALYSRLMPSKETSKSNGIVWCSFGSGFGLSSCSIARSAVSRWIHDRRFHSFAAWLVIAALCSDDGGKGSSSRRRSRAASWPEDRPSSRWRTTSGASWAEGTSKLRSSTSYGSESSVVLVAGNVVVVVEIVAPAWAMTVA